MMSISRHSFQTLRTNWITFFKCILKVGLTVLASIHWTGMIDFSSFDVLFFVVMAAIYILLYIALDRIVRSVADSHPNIVALRLKLHVLLEELDHKKRVYDILENTEINHIYVQYKNHDLIKDRIDRSGEVVNLIVFFVPLFTAYFLQISYDRGMPIKLILLGIFLCVDLLFLCPEIRQRVKLREKELAKTIGFVNEG
jgi:hypothetical protein